MPDHGRLYNSIYYTDVHGLTQQISVGHSQQPLDGPHYSLLTHPSPSCRDERWTYMYKVDRAAAAAFHLVLHSAGGLHIFDHASRPAVDTVVGCSSQQNGSQSTHSEFPVYYVHVVLWSVENLKCFLVVKL